MPSRHVCPERNIRGAWIAVYCLRARLDAPSGRTRLNSPSMANLLYQQPAIQQTQREWKKDKQNQSQNSLMSTALYNTPVVLWLWFNFCCWLLPTLASHWGSTIIMGFLCQLSERLLRVLAQHDNSATSMGTPVYFYRGAAIVAAFSGYSFGLLQKSTSPAVREPQCQTKSK